MNVLITCAGRRNYLVKFFQEALGGRGEVFAADASADAPALQQADKSFKLPPSNQTAYIETLLTLCQRNSVLLLLSLNDLELPILARHSARFRSVGTIPVISSPEVVDLCFDKWWTFKFLKSSNLEAPNTYLSLAETQAALTRGDISFPLVVKPRWGTASIGIQYPEDDEELQLDYALAKKRHARTILREINASDPEKCILIQRRVCGQEYGLDVINDLEGHYVCTLVKQKVGMRAGETDRARTIKSSRLERVGEMIGRRLGHIGVLDCDAILTEDGCYVLDMNPRFGGGYPFSHIAGANLPAVLLAWAKGERPDPHWLTVEPGIMASKYDDLVVVNTGPQLRPGKDRFDPLEQNSLVSVHRQTGNAPPDCLFQGGWNDRTDM